MKYWIILIQYLFNMIEWINERGRNDRLESHNGGFLFLGYSQAHVRTHTNTCVQIFTNTASTHAHMHTRTQTITSTIHTRFPKDWLRNSYKGDTWMAQLVQHLPFNLGRDPAVLALSPTSGSLLNGSLLLLLPSLLSLSLRQIKSFLKRGGGKKKGGWGKEGKK